MINNNMCPQQCDRSLSSSVEACPCCFVWQGLHQTSSVSSEDQSIRWYIPGGGGIEPGGTAVISDENFDRLIDESIAKHGDIWERLRGR